MSKQYNNYNVTYSMKIYNIFLSKLSFNKYQHLLYIKIYLYYIMIIYIIFLPKILIFLINLLNYYIISNTNSITNYQYFLYQKCITKNLVVFPIYISLLLYHS